MMTELHTDQKEVVLAILDTAYKARINNVRHSIEMTAHALNKAHQMEDTGLVAKCLNHFSLFYMIVGENQRALDHAYEAIKYCTQCEDEIGIADAKYNIGSVYYKTDNYHSGLVNLVDSLAIYKKHNEYSKESRVYKALGTIYEFFGDEKNALASYYHAIDAAKKVRDQNLESNAYNPISGIYLDQRNIVKAIEFIEKAIDIKKRTEDVRGLAFALYGRGKIYTYMRQYIDAESDFKEAERIHLQMGEKLGLAMTYYKMGIMYFQMGRFADSLTSLFTGRELSIKHNISQFKHKCDFQLYKVYKQMGDIDKALFYLEEHIATKEAVINIETLKIIENYEFISEQQLVENTELLKAKEQLELRNRELIKANTELDQFVYRASHDLRAPLSSILGLVNLGLGSTNPEEIKQCFHLIQERVEAQDYFIKEIVEYSRNARLALDLKEILIKKFITETANSLSFMEGASGIRITILADDNLTVRCDPSRLKSIVNNLVSNAIKYRDVNKDNQFINISVDFDDSHWTLVVEDNGIGIVDARKNKVFDMFYRGTEMSNGSGLGLFIVKETIATLGGTVTVESDLGVGSKFTVSFPFR